MKFLTRISALFLFSLIIFSCVNLDDPTAERPSGNWVFNGSNYSSTVVKKTETSIHFTQDAADGVQAIFNSSPSAKIGTYKVVKGPVAILADDEMVLLVDHGIGEAWYSTGVGNNEATVTRDGLGNIRITVLPVSVRHYKNNIIQPDSTVSSCVLIYK